MHTWTFAAELSHRTPAFTQANCPCSGFYNAGVTGQSAPDFIGNNYYCESGNPSEVWRNQLYSNDPLWDGQQCEGQCCSNGKSPPWFSVELPNPTTDGIEVLICDDQGVSNEDDPIIITIRALHSVGHVVRYSVSINCMVSN